MDLRARRRLIGQKESDARLPREYREIEYIEANKTQYFWADILVQDGLTVDAVQSFNVGDTFLFGGYADASANNRSAFNGMYAGRIQGVYPTSYYLVGGDILGGNRAIYHVVTMHGNQERKVYVDDVLISSVTVSGVVAQTGAPCGVFAIRSANAVGTDVALIRYAYSGRVYSLKVSKDNELLADYVPCYRRSDQKPGMYDLVTEKFYASESETDFIAGPRV